MQHYTLILHNKQTGTFVAELINSPKYYKPYKSSVSFRWHETTVVGKVANPTQTCTHTTQCDNEKMIKSSIKLNECEGAQLEKLDPKQSGHDEMMQRLNKMLFIRRLLEKASNSWVCCLRPQLPPDSLQT